MMPVLQNGKVYVPIILSRIQTEHGELWIDAMREMLPEEEGYDRLKEWLEKDLPTDG
jgi:hypothetical protein